MDETSIVSYYKNEANEFILMKRKSLAIEDEILDLDAISLSNEDTWLYSAGKGSLVGRTDSMDESNDTKSDHEELEKEFASCTFDIDKEALFGSDSTIITSDSQLLNSNDFEHCPFINSYDVLTNSTIENFLHTPANAKQKSDLLRRVLSSSSTRSSSKSKAESLKPFDDSTFKKPSLINSILHSVENKQSKCVDTGDSTKIIEGLRSRGDSGDNTPENAPRPLKKSGLTDEMAALTLSDSTDENNENLSFRRKTPPIWHSTPHSSAANGRGMTPVKKTLPLCNPSPVLMGRYLKYNKTEDATTKWRPSNEFANGDEEADSNKSEMNVSYIKYESGSNQCVNLPRINREDGDRSKGNLNSTFSKSEDMLTARAAEERLSSTYSNSIEDDLASSTSESSLSSVGNKQTLSIKEVKKMAELQERSLKNYNRSSYFAGSSKSSEVSSSSESISTFGALSSSNEGQINVINLKNAVPQRVVTENTMIIRNSRISTPSLGNNTYSRSDLKLDLASNRSIKQSATVVNDETFVATMLKSKLSLPNGHVANTKVLPGKKLPNTKLSVPLSKPSISNANNEEIVSVKEIGKLKGATNVKTAVVEPISTATNKAPHSHIPRPSSRIPMPRSSRSSASCTRYSKS